MQGSTLQKILQEGKILQFAVHWEHKKRGIHMGRIRLQRPESVIKETSPIVSDMTYRKLLLCP